MPDKPLKRDHASPGANGDAPTPAVPGRDEAAEVQGLSELDQSLADSDQTAADSEQSAADRDESASEQDQLAADRDQAAADKDQAAHHRSEPPEEGNGYARSRR